MLQGIQSVLAQAVPAVTIVGLVVLLALGKIEQTAGLSLIGALAGVHGGAVVASNAAVKTAAASTPNTASAPSAPTTPTP